MYHLHIPTTYRVCKMPDVSHSYLLVNQDGRHMQWSYAGLMVSMRTLN